jgi:AP endonuclease 2
MKILGWNVNGIRSLKNYYPWNETKDFQELVPLLDADIICFQEVKAADTQLPSEYTWVPGFDCFYHLCKKRAYCGVATIVRKDWAPVEVEFGFSGQKGKSKMGGYDILYQRFSKERLAQLDGEGRVLISDHQHFVLINAYFPALTEDSRLEFKMDFSQALQIRIESLLNSGRQVILVGDINVAHKEIDHCDPQQSIKDHNLTSFGDMVPRIWFDKMLSKSQLLDTFRYFWPSRVGAYTCWNVVINARSSNYGTRIDYILVSRGLEKWLASANVCQDIMGSDHCPVLVEFKDRLYNEALLDFVKNDLKKPAIGATFYWNNYGARQQKLDMFFKKGVKKTVIPAIKPSTVSKQQSASIATTFLGVTKKQRSIKSFFTKAATLENTNTLTDLHDFPKYDPILFETKEKAREQWKKIMQSKPIPNCHHNEPCKLQKVIKGPKKGNYFFVCDRPVGVNSRCDFFLWK